MAAPKDFLTGFNHNVRHKGQGYHVQTEDSGEAIGHVLTHLFQGGNILASKKTSYAELRGTPDIKVLVRALMEEQHRQMLRQLVNGAFDSSAAPPRIEVPVAEISASSRTGSNEPQAQAPRSTPAEVIRFAPPGPKELGASIAPFPASGAAAGPSAGASSGAPRAPVALQSEGGTGFLPPVQRAERATPSPIGSPNAPQSPLGSPHAAPSPVESGRAPPAPAGSERAPQGPVGSERASYFAAQAGQASFWEVPPRALQPERVPPTDVPSARPANPPEPPAPTAASRSNRPAPAWPTAEEAAYFVGQDRGPAASPPPVAAAPSNVARRAISGTHPSSRSPTGPFQASDRTPGPPDWRQDAPAETIFGEDLISEKSLDQVILRYLAGDRDD